MSKAGAHRNTLIQMLRNAVWRYNQRYAFETGEEQEVGRWQLGEDGTEVGVKAEDREQKIQDSHLQEHAQKAACNLDKVRMC